MTPNVPHLNEQTLQEQHSQTSSPVSQDSNPITATNLNFQTANTQLGSQTDFESKTYVTQGITILHGRYQLDKIIGRGGMGVVYEALDLQTDTRVAVKLILDTANHKMDDAQYARSYHRFKREAQVLIELQHPNVINLISTGTEHRQPYYVMELLDAIPVLDFIKKKPLDIESTSEIFLQLLSGLSHIHKSGLVHRDIKSENILVTEDGHLKILDFGLVKNLDSLNNTQLTANLMIGTIKYMSPEQFYDSSTVDHRSDLYSAAILLYKMLTGDFPFEEENIHEHLRHKSANQFQPICETFRKSTGAELPSACDVFFERALANNPRSRFQSAQYFGESLIALLSLEIEQTHFETASSMQDTTMGTNTSGSVLGASSRSMSADLTSQTDFATMYGSLPFTNLSTVGHGKKRTQNWLLASVILLLVGLGLFTQLKPSEAVEASSNQEGITVSKNSQPKFSIVKSQQPPTSELNVISSDATSLKSSIDQPPQPLLPKNKITPWMQSPTQHKKSTRAHRLKPQIKPESFSNEKKSATPEKTPHEIDALQRNALELMDLSDSAL